MTSWWISSAASSRSPTNTHAQYFSSRSALEIDSLGAGFIVYFRFAPTKRKRKKILTKCEWQFSTWTDIEKMSFSVFFAFRRAYNVCLRFTAERRTKKKNQIEASARLLVRSSHARTPWLLIAISAPSPTPIYASTKANVTKRSLNSNRILASTM
jgi:hypothetical protein